MPCRPTLALSLIIMISLPALAQIGINEPATPSTRTATLKGQLINGLKATRPEEREWLAQIVVLVDNGELGRDLVNAVFKWARRRSPKAPFPHYERGLRVLAMKRGVELPPFEYRLAAEGGQSVSNPVTPR
jgi:hypothetical protein